MKKLYKTRATLSIAVDLYIIAESEEELKKKAKLRGKEMAAYVASLDDSSDQFNLIGTDADDPVDVPNEFTKDHCQLLEYGYPMELVKKMDADEAEGELEVLCN